MTQVEGDINSTKRFLNKYCKFNANSKDNLNKVFMRDLYFKQYIMASG